MGDESERLHAFNAWECQQVNHALKPHEGPRVEKRSEVVHEDLDTIHRRVHGLSPVMVSGVAPDPMASHGAAQPYHSGGEEALRHALLHILGDMPSPLENPWERCRGIAAEALGYQKPDPMASHDPGIGLPESGSLEESVMLSAGHKTLTAITGHSVSSYALIASDPRRMGP